MMLKKTRILFLLLLILLTAVACASETEDPVVEETAVPEVTEPETETPAETPAEEAAVDAPAEEAVAEAPTDEPAAEPTAVPPAEPAADRFGIVRFRDSDTFNSGGFQLLLEGVAPAPAGAHYELWLVDDNLNALNLGPFEVAADGNVQLTGNVEQNLLATYSGAFVSLEPDGVDDGEVGTVVYNGTVPAGALLHIRHVASAFPANPDSNAFLIGAQSQIQVAIEHTGFLLDELANDNLREAQRHAEHVVNILDGETGETFGDLDGDTVAQNPGDGFGVRAYLEGAKEHTNLALGADGVTAEIQLHADHVLISSDNALGRIDAAIAEAVRIISSDSAGEAQGAAEELAALLDAALNGADANGDGSIAPIVDEGGILVGYVHAQNMGAFEFFASDGVAAAPVPVQEAPPAEEPTAVPTEAAAAPTSPPPAAGAVTIDMANFAFSPNDITVPAGTAVTWVNKDSGPRHSATASDNSFDTGLFDAGEQSTLTFDTPGTFVYYCTLHGSPDGSGMAATITVTDQ